MYQKKLDDKTFVIRVVKGEMAMETIIAFCTEHGIKGGYFTGIGAVDMAEIAHYNLETKQYSTKRIEEALEVTNMTGNVALYKNDLIIHAHVTLSNRDMQAIGGHVVELRISGTLELFFTHTETLVKEDDPDTGLKLLSLER